MTWTQRTIVVLTLLALTACSTGYASPPARGSQPPRTRCLSDPNETGTRPLFFLFCVESP
jgi:hypothetical protein